MMLCERLLSEVHARLTLQLGIAGELRKASSLVVTSTWRSLGSINALVDAMFPPLRQHLQVVFMTEHDVAIW